MPIPVQEFTMSLEEYSERYLRQNPWATPERARMEWLNAQAGPQLAAMAHQAAERQLSGVDLTANLEKAYELIGAALGFLRNNGSKQ